ncbi:cysteine desulfuration protein [Ectocarpus siliculosus]|uniref:Cysteine desulfuration protein n=1 Tax=Ectocarpus siliculosus TaxID=2880 RepID=D7G7R0_ECTSI|nr:cysteine desulfuration protein [Ectocarpus siliculosus]|eukprot:CBJ27791.1 cysteine desulfuration protein [Ectocarpus siliculosus]
MVARAAILSVALTTSVCSVGEAFVTPNVAVVPGGAFSSHRAAQAARLRRPAARAAEPARSGRDAPLMSTSTDLKELGLTPELERLTKVFRSCPTDKMRQMQLLHLAQMGDKMDPALQTEENKVLGCLSTVYVAAEVKDGLIYYSTDSDAMITKGLAGLLAMGLSGNSPEAIQTVKPEFIQVAGLQASLTAGRNNGFINMLRTMKGKALALGGESAIRAAVEQAAPAAEEAAAEEPEQSGTMASRITEKLQKLEPLKLVIEDESGGEESKFMINIVSKSFEGLTLLKRHRSVYGLMADEMKIVHAVTLDTKTPEEVGM